MQIFSYLRIFLSSSPYLHLFHLADNFQHKQLILAALNRTDDGCHVRIYIGGIAVACNKPSLRTAATGGVSTSRDGTGGPGVAWKTEQVAVSAAGVHLPVGMGMVVSVAWIRVAACGEGCARWVWETVCDRVVCYACGIAE